MTQAIDLEQPEAHPSVDACTRLLRAMPAMSAFRRAIRDVAPADALGWLGTLVVVVRHEDGVRPSHVAEALMVDLSVVSRAIAQLEELGYAERSRDARDGRARIVHATEAGRAALAALVHDFAEHVAGLLGGWSDDDVDSLAAQLHRFEATLSTSRGGAR